MAIVLRPLDTSQVQGAFAQLGAVNERNKQRRMARRQRTMGLVGALAGAGLGVAFGPAIGLGALKAAGGGAQIGSSLFAGDPVGAGMGALNMGGMAEQAQAGQAVKRALLGMRTPVIPEVGATGTVEDLTPQARERNALLGAFGEMAPPRPDVALQGALVLRTPQPEGPDFGFTNVPGVGLVRTDSTSGDVMPTGIGGEADDKGAFGGSFRAQLFANVRDLAPTIAAGEGTREQQSNYALAYSDLSRPQTIMLPDGSQKVLPGINLQELGFPAPTQLGQQAAARAQEQPQAAGEAGQKRVTADPMTPAEVNRPRKKPITPAQQETVQFRQQAKRMLDVMEQNIDKTGRVQGWISEAGAFLGVDDDAIAFKQARANMRLSLQASIKGVPSDRDQVLVDDLLPNLTDPPAVVKTKIRLQREALNAADSADRDYFEENNMAVPVALQEAARQEGQDPEQYAARPTTEKEFNALPSGAIFVDPEDGKFYRKK